jgi:hypothetical protein
MVTPPRRSQVAAATIPPGLVTRAISFAASTPSGPNMSTRLERTRSKLRSEKGRAHASPGSKRMRSG